MMEIVFEALFWSMVFFGVVFVCGLWALLGAVFFAIRQTPLKNVSYWKMFKCYGPVGVLVEWLWRSR